MSATKPENDVRKKNKSIWFQIQTLVMMNETKGAKHGLKHRHPKIGLKLPNCTLLVTSDLFYMPMRGAAECPHPPPPLIRLAK